MVEYIHSIKVMGITASNFITAMKTIQILKYWNICQEIIIKFYLFTSSIISALILIYRDKTLKAKILFDAEFN